uniref:Uncharacterized protein n=1 Tax=Arundo donax TaxID=35708 RepID=A0A0A8YBN1_ARUDO
MSTGRSGIALLASTGFRSTAYSRLECIKRTAMANESNTQ